MSEQDLSTSRFTPFPYPPGTLTPEPSIYFGVDDFLLVTIRNAATGVTLQINGLIFQADSSRSYFSQSIVPATDRTASTIIFQPGEGWLRSLIVRVQAGTVSRGQCFATVDMQRGSTANGLIIQRLVSHYVSNVSSPSWPLSPIQSAQEGIGFFRSVTGTDQPAGSEISETVPAGAIWELYSMNFNLVTDSTAGTRRVHVIIDDGANILSRVPFNGTQAISLTQTYSYGLAVYASSLIDTCLVLPTQYPIRLQPGWRIRTLTSSLSAADNFSAPQLLVEEFIAS